MFGVGADEGQTTMRLRYAYGQLGKFLVGQATSPFMDDDVWPNTVEYWGPTGMVFYRNVQVRYMPIKKDDKELFFALERPGSGADKGTISSPELPLDSVKAQLSAPDVSAHFKKRGKWGSVQLAGIFRPIKWKDTRQVIPNGTDNSGSVTGWGVHLSASDQFRKEYSIQRLLCLRRRHRKLYAGCTKRCWYNSHRKYGQTF